MLLIQNGQPQQALGVIKTMIEFFKEGGFDDLVKEYEDLWQKLDKNISSEENE